MADLEDPNIIIEKVELDIEEDAFNFKSFSHKESIEIINSITQLENNAYSYNILENDVIKNNIALSDTIEVGIINKLQVFQEQPELLDPHLDKFISPLMKVVRTILLKAKVRGYKTIVKFFPHSVADLEPTLNCLMAQNSKEYDTWEVRYSLLLWMSIVILIPFDLATVDSTNGTLVTNLLNTCKHYLSDAGPTRDMAAVLLSKFFSRKDTKTYLTTFIEWCLLSLKTSDAFLTTGIYSFLSCLWKTVSRDTLLPFAASLTELCFNPNSTVFNRKLTSKLIQRIGMAYLKPKEASWRYSIATKSLADNLKGVTRASEESKEAIEEEIFVPEEVEEIIAYLLESLRDKETNVRWSSAKGLGRIVSRLPLELADEVLTTVGELFSAGESDSAWHGGCLALAELTRRGLILPRRLDEIVVIVNKALVYELNRGSHGIGAHVRDAACYVCWAMARAYKPDILLPHISLAQSLINVAVFDRDINCRRAGAAAYQECVGRLGIFPNGIAVNTLADYFTIGIRSNAFTQVAIEISKFPFYLPTITSSLLQKLVHFDRSIRELSAETLKLLVKVDQNLIQKVLPNLLPLCLSTTLDIRHGSTLGAAAILYASAELGVTIDEEIQKVIRNLIPKIEAARLYTGKGGTFMRLGVSKLIESIASCKFPLTSKLIARLQDTLDENIKNASEEVQVEAIHSLRVYALQYYVLDIDIKEAEARVDKYIKTLANDKIFSCTRGAASAMGQMPYVVLQRCASKIIPSLLKGIEIQPNADDRDAETRRNSLLALFNVCETLYSDASATVDVNELLRTVGNACLNALKDYCIDNRGDIGSWVREAGMQVLGKLLPLMVSRNGFEIELGFIQNVYTSLVKQLMEKINRVRTVAGDILLKLLYSNIPHIPNEVEIKAFLPNGTHYDWSAPSVTFPILIKFLDFSIYRRAALEGLIVSVGGLTESLVRSAGNCMLSYFMQDDCDLGTLAEDFISIANSYRGDGRIIVPLFKTLDMLFTNGGWNSFFTEPVCEKANKFALDILQVLSIEMKSIDLSKIVAGINLYSGFIGFNIASRNQFISQLLLLLQHRFPKIRKVASSKFYSTLLLAEILPDETLDEVLDILTSTPWEIEDIVVAAAATDTLFLIFDLEKPIVLETISTRSNTKDENSSYLDLVRDEHYK